MRNLNKRSQENFEELTESNEEEVLETTRKEVMTLMKKTIRPEFLNRIDEVIMFTPLTKNEIHDIVSLMFGQVKKMLAKNGISIELTEQAVDRLAEIGYDPQFGARPLKRVIQKEVLNSLSKMILAGKVTGDHKILVDVNGDEFIFKNE